MIKWIDREKSALFHTKYIACKHSTMKSFSFTGFQFCRMLVFTASGKFTLKEGTRNMSFVYAYWGLFRPG